MRPEVVLDDGLAGLVFVFATLLVAPPEVGGFGAALFALHAAAGGVVEEFDGGSLVHFDFPDAVVEVVVVFVAVGVFGHVAAGVEGGSVGGDFVVGVVRAVFGLPGQGVAGPVAVVVIDPSLIRRLQTAAPGVGGDAVAGVIRGVEAGGGEQASVGEGLGLDLLVGFVGVGHGEGFYCLRSVDYDVGCKYL